MRLSPPVLITVLGVKFPVIGHALIHVVRLERPPISCNDNAANKIPGDCCSRLKALFPTQGSECRGACTWVKKRAENKKRRVLDYHGAAARGEAVAVLSRQNDMDS